MLIKHVGYRAVPNYRNFGTLPKFATVLIIIVIIIDSNFVILSNL